MNGRLAITVCAAGLAMVLSTGTAGAADAAARLDYPHAGISLSLPAGFATMAPQEPSVVCHAAPEGGAGRLAMTLSVMPVAPGSTPEGMGDGLLAELQANPDFSGVERLKRLPASIAGRPGRLEVLSYTAHGEETVATRGLFVREISDDVTLGYVLTVEALRENSGAVSGVLRPVLGSLELSKVRAPRELSLGTLGEAVSDLKPGYRVRCPHGWYVVRPMGGVEMAQADLLRGGLLARWIGVRASKAGEGETAAGLLDEYIRVAKRARGVRYETVSTGPAELAGHTGVQRIVRPVLPRPESAEPPGGEPAPALPGEPAGAGEEAPGTVTLPSLEPEPSAGPDSATEPEPDPEADADAKPEPEPASEPARPAEEELTLVVHRAVVVDTAAGRRAYSLMLICCGEPERAENLMGELAKGFELIEPAGDAAATRPAEE